MTQPQSIGDQRKADEADEHRVEFLEAREDTAVALEAAEESLDLVAALVHLAVVLSGFDPGAQRRYDGDEPQIERQLSRLVALVGSVHQQVQRAIGAAQSPQQRTTLWRMVRLAVQPRERYGRSSIRGNHMNLGVPTTSGLADGSGAVFFNAPVPSGCSLMLVLSSDTALILVRTTWARWSCSNNRG